MLKPLLLAALAAVSFTAHAAESLLARINNHGTIVVATDGAYPPFNYHDASGKLTGYDIEVTRAIAEKLGITVDFQETLWDGMLAGLKSGRFDAVANQVTLGTPERRAAFAGAIPYSWTGAMVLTRKDDDRVHDIADLKGLKAGQTLNSNHAQRAEAAGVDAIAVHGRTREQFYSGNADYAAIAAVKRAVRIPVIVSGDVRRPADLKRALEITGADAVMIGRGAQGNPWIFPQLIHWLHTGEELPPPTLAERAAVILRHLDLLVGYKGEYIGIREMRKHAAWYTRGLKGSAELRERFNRAASRTEFAEILHEAWGV